MTTETTIPAATTTPEKALAAATKATAVAYAAIAPANDALAAAREALDAANAEAIAAIVVKNPDAAAARDRIEKSRAAVKAAEDDVTWKVVELHAREAQHEQACEAEQAARRAVTIEEYVAEMDRCSDPNNHEAQLLATLQSVVTETIIALSDRDALHNRLNSQWASIPADEKPRLACSCYPPGSSASLRGEFIADLHPIVAEALKQATAAAAGQLRRR